MPLVGSVFTSRNWPLEFVTGDGKLPVSVEPSGFRIETYAEPVSPDPDAAKLTRSPAAPENDSRAFAPGTVIDTATGSPPAVIESETS